MKLMPLRKIAAPSPSVLSFLRAQVRHAFGSPTVHCATLKRQRCAYGTVVKVHKGADSGLKCGGVIAARTRPLFSGSCVLQHTPFNKLRTARLDLALLRPCLTASDASALQKVEFLPNRRNFSSIKANRIWLFGGRKGGQSARLQPPPFKDMTDVPSGFDSLGRMTRAANELKMRCTELDEHGNVTMVSGEFKKSELIARYGLLPRDLRKIDSSMLPNILIRPTAILINLLHIRALIKHNRVLVFDAYGTTDSKSQSVFMYDLDMKLRQKDSPASVANGQLAYEHRALEAVLISVTSSLETEFEGVSEPVVRVLMELEEDIDRDKLRYLLVYSKKLGTFEQKARLVRDALTELLEADDDLASMYLSEKAEGKIRGEDDHTEVEMLLESYHKVADEIVQAAENLVSSIRNTEEIVKAILDANRNSLMLLDLRFSILTLSITAGTFVAALYGMNLKNFIEETDLGFPIISAWCTVFGIGVMVWGLTRLRRVQRLSMWGHGGGAKSTKGGWGLGAPGGGGRLPRGGPDVDVLGVPRLRAGDSLGGQIQRERAVASRVARTVSRRMAQADAKADARVDAAADAAARS